MGCSRWAFPAVQRTRDRTSKRPRPTGPTRHLHRCRLGLCAGACSVQTGSLHGNTPIPANLPCQTLCKLVVSRAQPVCLLLSDSDVREDAFLQYLNQLLVAAEVPGLFTAEESEALALDLQASMKQTWPGGGSGGG